MIQCCPSPCNPRKSDKSKSYFKPQQNGVHIVFYRIIFYRNVHHCYIALYSDNLKCNYDRKNCEQIINLGYLLYIYSLFLLCCVYNNLLYPDQFNVHGFRHFFMTNFPFILVVFTGFRRSQ